MATRTNVPPMRSKFDWNDFTAFKVINTTTNKLGDELAELGFHNQVVSDGDGEPEKQSDQFGWVPAPAYHYVLQVTHTGGRDWSIICGLEFPQA